MPKNLAMQTHGRKAWYDASGAVPSACFKERLLTHDIWLQQA